jgi:hypothetical protein
MTRLALALIEFVAVFGGLFGLLALINAGAAVLLPGSF